MKRKRSLAPLITFLIFISVGFWLLSNESITNYNQTEFEKTIEEDADYKFKDVIVTPKEKIIKINGKILVDGEWSTFVANYPNSEANYNKLISQLNKKIPNNEEGVILKEPSNVNWVVIIVQGIFMILVISIVIRAIGNASKRGMDFGRSRAKLHTSGTVKFKNIAGAKEEKEELIELVEFLKNKDKYIGAGARVPKGVLLIGPPGTGKTLLARGVAGEANVPFFSIAGSEFEEMFVGVGSSRVRNMFKQAKKNAPCIVFIDEIDAVGKNRGRGYGLNEQTLNQLLVEMDGFEQNSGVIIMAATNRADVLDPALLRAGRFDRKISVHLPDVFAREEILRLHASNKKISPDVNFENLARRTPGFSGADLENTLNEAALLSVRDKNQIISLAHIDEAVDRVIGGPAKHSKKRNKKAQRLVAYHEAGHAIVGLKLADAEVVQKVTIVPRGAAGGYVMMTPKEETYIFTKQQLKHKIASYVAGRVSEEIHFGKENITTGAADDLNKATKIARKMVTEFGMSDKIGPIQIESPDNSIFTGMPNPRSMNKFGGEISKIIDDEIKKLIIEGEKEAYKIISKYKDKVGEIAEALLKYETLNAEMIENIDKYGDPFYNKIKSETSIIPTDLSSQEKETNVVKSKKDNPDKSKKTQEKK